MKFTLAHAKALPLAVCVLLASLAAQAAPSADDKYYIYLKAVLSERFGKPASALPQYEKLAAQDPESPFLHQSMVVLSMRLNKKDKALEEAQKLVALSPQDAKAQVLLGRVHLSRGEIGPARDAFDKAVALDPGKQDALLYSAQLRIPTDPQTSLKLYQRILDDDPGSLEALSRIAEIELDLGHIDKSIDGWNQVLAYDSDNLMATLALANIYEIQKDTQAVFDLYEKARALDPNNVSLLYHLGELYYREGESAKAQEAFVQAANLAPDTPTAHFWLGLLAEEKKDWPTAAAEMKKAAHGRDDAGVLMRLAYYYSQMGRGKDAVAILRRLAKSYPSNPDFHYYLAMGYEDINKPRPAIDSLQKSLALDPDRIEAYYHLGANWDALKEHEKAEAALMQVVALDPNHASALNFLAYSWAERNVNLDKALEFVQRALLIDANNGAYLDTLGWVYYRLGRLVEAETALLTAAQRVSDPVVWEHLAEVLTKEGKPDAARDAYQEAYFLSPKKKNLKNRAGDFHWTVTARSPLRRMLKLSEGNFKQLKSLKSFAMLDAEAARKKFEAPSLIYFGAPKNLRFEVLGPFYITQFFLVKNGDEIFWVPSNTALAGFDAGPALTVLTDLLSGDLSASYDDPSVTASMDGPRIVYKRSDGATLTVDPSLRMVVKVSVPKSPAHPAFELQLKNYQNVDGIWVPFNIAWSLSPIGKLSIHLGKPVINAPLDAALFQRAAASSQR